MLTRKTFELMAAQIRLVKDTTQRNLLIANAIKVCKESNPRFNVKLFRAACNA